MASRNLLVLGATGGTGAQVVSQALERNHVVTVLVRHPERLVGAAARMRVVTGDVTDGGPALVEAIRGQDAVISTLGVGNSLKSSGLIAHSVPAIVRAMETEGVRRLIFTSAYGVGITWRDVPLVPRLMMRLLLRDVYADKATAEDDLRRSRLDWTLVYPVMLTNARRTSQYRVGQRLKLRGIPRVSRADVADFLLAQVDDKTYIRKGVLISGH